jgi:hypothetical protein
VYGLAPPDGEAVAEPLAAVQLAGELVTLTVIFVLLFDTTAVTVFVHPLLSVTVAV